MLYMQLEHLKYPLPLVIAKDNLLLVGNRYKFQQWYDKQF